jgi:HlyD family secretion protein
MKTVLALLVVVALAAGGGAYYIKYVAVDPPPGFRTVPVKRDNLLPTITATGTLEPEEVVDVGSQVTGRIIKFGADLGGPDQEKAVDYRSVVKRDQLLALIDDTLYKAQRNQAQALLEHSKADLLQLKANAVQAEQDWIRAESLHANKAISESDYDLCKAKYETAKAMVAVGDATIKQNDAALQMAQTNLDYTVINSPVDGEIIARRVNIGQTVVSNLSASSLFLIGKDLRRMQVWAQVNEADIGRIREGMPVRFTVDAYPNETFRGKVFQVRFDAQSTQNVVNYTVVVQTDNSDRKLYPYMTANVQFELDERTNVLQVPNAALRWKPSKPQLVVAEARDATSRKSSGKGGGKGDSTAAKASGDVKADKPAKERVERGRIWVVTESKLVRPIDVKTGISDGSQTEISGENLEEGLEVVVAEVVGAQDSGDTTNPFAPKLFNKGGAGGPKGMR